MRRFTPFVVLCVLVVTAGLLARPRVKTVVVDDQGQARVQMSQRQIFDEVGGKADVKLDLGGGLAVLDSDMSLPEEAGDISGQSWLSLGKEALTVVGDFTYLPLKSKQMKLDVDYHSVEDENRASGVNSFSLDYPLSLENVGASMADYLAKTSYTVTGKAKWSQYTQASGKLQIKIQDPDLRSEPVDLNVFGIRIVDSATTDILMHLEAVGGSQWAQILQSSPEEMEFILGGAMRYLGVSPRDIRLSNVRAGGGKVQGDISMSFFNLREQIAQTSDDLLRFMPPIKGVRREDIVVALTTMLGVEFKKLDIVIRRKADHFDVEVEGSARKVDQCIIGYLRLMEVLEPALVEAKTQDRGLSALVKSIDAVRTRRFRNVVIAAAQSQDGGDVQYDLAVKFPNGRMRVDAKYSYSSVLKAYSFAHGMMKLPVIHQSYSMLKVKTTPGGLQGHYLYEAQGPWFQSHWALLSEAAKGNADLKALFPASSKLAIEDGRVLLKLDKSEVKGSGWMRVADLSRYARSLVALKAGGVEPLALSMSYDADEQPGKILGDLYLKGKSPDAVRKAIAAAYAGAKMGKGPVKLPTVTQPSVEIPKELAAEIEADRKALGVVPWQPTPVAAPKAKPSTFNPAVAALVVAGVLLFVGGFVFLLRQRQMQMYVAAEVGGVMDPSRTQVVGPDNPFRAMVTPVAPPSPMRPPVPLGTPPAPPSPLVAPPSMDDKAAFKAELMERIFAAWPGCEVTDKDQLEVFVLRDGQRVAVDLEPLYYLVARPNIDREKAVQSFVSRLPGAG